MFSLIIGLISVALVAALALATTYYGGGVLERANAQAKATRLSNEAEQIQGAITLYKRDNNGNLPSSLADLSADGTYLNGVPLDVWTNGVSFIQTNTNKVEGDVCLEFNKKRGVPLIPTCTDPLYNNVVVCCENPPGQ